MCVHNNNLFKFSDGNVSFVIPRENGGHVIGFHREIYNLDWESEKVTIIAEDAESKAYRMSDGKCDATGRLWAGECWYRGKINYCNTVISSRNFPKLLI